MGVRVEGSLKEGLNWRESTGGVYSRGLHEGSIQEGSLQEVVCRRNLQEGLHEGVNRREYT